MPHSSVLEQAAMAAATALGFFLMASMANQIWGRQALMKHIATLQAELINESSKRAADRAGRIRAEQQLKEARLQLASLQAAPSSGVSQPPQHTQQNGQAQQPGQQQQQQQQNVAGSPPGSPRQGGSSMPVYPFRPIGVLRTCFSQRNGTPRQPLLVPAARAVLQLSQRLSPALLEGLEQYSHCWVLYVFHANTDLAKLMAAQAAGSSAGGAGHGVKAKVTVPRLNGGRMGVLATRTPHRPVPIGLSVAQVLRVEQGVLWLGGADIVDGTPVLDIKPYLPFADGVPNATAPAWVQEVAADEPLAVGNVVMSPAAAASIAAAWQQVAKQQRQSRSPPLYQRSEDYLQLVRQVLSRDIRSLHQRQQMAGSHGAASQLHCTTSTLAAPCSDSHAPGGPQGQERELSAGQQAAVGHAAPQDECALEGPLGIGKYHVVLDGVDISYNCDQEGNINVCQAQVHC